MRDATDTPPDDATRDARLSALTSRSGGVVSHEELVELGFDREAIRRRKRKGDLHEIHPRVYAKGHTALTDRGRWLAAVKAGGDQSCISHYDAAILHRLLKPWLRRAIEITLPRRKDPTAKLKPHFTKCWHRDDHGTIDGIPVTSLARTLLDIAETEPPNILDRCIHEADHLETLDLDAIERLIARSAGRRGVKPLRAALTRAGHGLPDSPLVEQFEAFLIERGLPLPEFNDPLAGHDWDCSWPQFGLVADIDGYRVHKTRRTFEDDRDDDIAAQLEGLRIARITHLKLTRHRDRLERELRGLMALGVTVRG